MEKFRISVRSLVEFLLHSGEVYAFVNREDDVGDEGLRAAKLSYNPDIIEPKYLAALNK